MGDLARQTRAQHASADNKPSRAQGLVDEMQQEQEVQQNAPVGFANFDAGDYRLLVPYPYSLEGRDNGGAIVAGSSLGVTNTEVLAGNPIPIPANASDRDVLNLAHSFAGQHGNVYSCYYSANLGEHKTIQCGMSGNPRLLGREVWGTMKILVTSKSLIPIMCVSPDEFQCVGYYNGSWSTCSNRHPSWDEVQRTQRAVQTRFRNELTTAQMCEQVIYPSIQLKEDVVVHPATIAEKKIAPAPADVPIDHSVTSTPEGPSVAELARATRQSPHPKPQATLNNSEGSSAPAGYQTFNVQFCLNPMQCSEASVIIPEKAEVVSRINGQHIFKTFVDGEEMTLYAGPAAVASQYNGLTDADFRRIRDLANPNGWSHEKTDGVSTQDLTIEGKPALMTRFRYQRDQKRWWIGERLLIGSGGLANQFLVGCSAPEEHFADAEVYCTTLVKSLRLK